MKYIDLINQCPDAYPISEWICSHILDFHMWPLDHLKNGLRNVEYRTWMMAAGELKGDWASHHETLTATLRKDWSTYIEYKAGGLRHLKDHWVYAIRELALENRTPNSINWWKINSLWDPEAIRYSDHASSYKVEIRLRINGEWESWHGKYLK